LNRQLRWTGKTIEYEADEKHALEIVREMGLDSESKGLEAPYAKDEVNDGDEEEEDQSVLLEPEDARKFRGLAARGNYLAQDRMDIQYAAKEICRYMAAPRFKAWSRLKRLGRYLLVYPRLIWRFTDDGSHEGDFIDVYSDSDWAGNKITRKSTSGGVASISGGALKHWSSTQGTVAMSVGEAEYYAMVKAAAEGLGIQSLAKDLGYDFGLRIWVDSTTAKAIASRIGLGRVRHMEVKYLWAQEAHKNARFQIRKIASERNPSDVLTKPKSATDMKQKLAMVGASIQKKGDWLRIKSGSRVQWADVKANDFGEELEESD
jgi:hypothetical protein